MPVDYSGTEGRPIAVTNVVDTLLVPLSVNGVHGTAIVDTGSPVVALDPSVFVGAGLPDGQGTVDDLTVGSLTFTRPSVLGANLISSPDPTITVGGSLGCGVLCDFAVSLDYRAATVTLGTSTPPSDIADPGSSIPFTLGGGGTATITGVPGNVVFPPSRIEVDATIEGVAHAFMVDTGSSFVTLRKTVFAGLIADGRTEIRGIGTATVGQESSSAVTRLRSFSVGDEEIDGLVAASDPSIDDSLDSVGAEVGYEVDGLVGGSFLRQFYVTIDYPNSALRLRRYTTGGPTYDTFDRIGAAVAPAQGTTPATVAQVLTGTDAATQGMAVGDQIVAIDGKPLAALGSTAIDELLSGPVGSSKTVQFGVAKSALLSEKTVFIGVDDILPL